MVRDEHGGKGCAAMQIRNLILLQSDYLNYIHGNVYQNMYRKIEVFFLFHFFSFHFLVLKFIVYSVSSYASQPIRLHSYLIF